MRVLKKYDSPYYYYIPDRLGSYLSIDDVYLKKVTCSSAEDFEQDIMGLEYWQRYETDLDPLERVLMDNYNGKPVPKLKVAFIDIEVDYNPLVGFARIEDPYAPINALTLFLKDSNTYVTLAVPPQGWDASQGLGPELEHVTICKNERELLEIFLDLLHDIDVISGWNSEFFDIPYIGKRVELLFGESGLKRLGFEHGPAPRWSERVKFKHSTEKAAVLVLNSRVHLDYLRLFKKFNLTTRKSFGLEAVGSEELGVPKLHYDGTLSELYNQDFPKFLRYNTHDVRIIVLLDDKFKYIELANQMAHMATVNFEAVFGSVQLIDTAIINHAHAHLNRIVFDRRARPAGDPVEGAVVLTPMPGFYEWIAACDINSLYPSTIRSLNLSIEKIVGQLVGRPGAAAAGEQLSYRIPQHKVKTPTDHEPQVRYGREARQSSYLASLGKKDELELKEFGAQSLDDVTRFVYDEQEYAWLAFKEANERPDDERAQAVLLDVKLEGSAELLTMTAGELAQLCREKHYSISAFGTILDQGNGEGLVPTVLTSWFKGRKEMQAEKKKQGKLKDELLAAGRAKDDPEVKEAERLEAYYDVLQGVRKVLLNSTYGALLNEFARFGDPRLGASVTYTGRQITQHMINTVASTLNELNPPKVVKSFDIRKYKDSKTGTDGEHDRRWGANYYDITIPQGLGPIYGDTDSVYFTMAGVVSNEDDAIAVADSIADAVNASFPEFMRSSFNCNAGYDSLIKANRELVCRSGILQAKKKYMMKVIDKEGKRVEAGSDDELKTMGSDIRVSSTPELIREMLKEVVMLILEKRPKSEVDKVIISFRESISKKGLTDINPLDICSVVSVNKMEQYETLIEGHARLAELSDRAPMKKLTIPLNIRATRAYNSCEKLFNLTDFKRIDSGNKIKILWLKPNEHEFTAMAFPSDFDELPQWFLDNFEVDTKEMELKLVDQKLQLIFDAIAWEVPTFQSQLTNALLQFD